MSSVSFLTLAVLAKMLAVSALMAVVSAWTLWLPCPFPHVPTTLVKGLRNSIVGIELALPAGPLIRGKLAVDSLVFGELLATPACGLFSDGFRHLVLLSLLNLGHLRKA